MMPRDKPVFRAWLYCLKNGMAIYRVMQCPNGPTVDMTLRQLEAFQITHKLI